MTWQITGRVSGVVMFPDHPEHEGRWGLNGGEDVIAERSTFRSIGEAMTWCRKVLDGKVMPQWWAPGEIPATHDEPYWQSARVTVTSNDPYNDDPDDPWWEASPGGDRSWRQVNREDSHGTIVRTDPLPG